MDKLRTWALRVILPSSFRVRMYDALSASMQAHDNAIHAAKRSLNVCQADTPRAARLRGVISANTRALADAERLRSLFPWPRDGLGMGGGG